MVVIVIREKFGKGVSECYGGDKFGGGRMVRIQEPKDHQTKDMGMEHERKRFQAMTPWTEPHRLHKMW